MLVAFVVLPEISTTPELSIVRLQSPVFALFLTPNTIAAKVVFVLIGAPLAFFVIIIGLPFIPISDTSLLDDLYSNFVVSYDKLMLYP